ncbi:N-formylglutamate amidohydrolase [Phenylobacterium sp. LjRoot225]|uniref:N-formylglutamate amidohydrolase n=1 Tax=Phenylobacterium sp. LjRoot225 TaxID=3342285 RepID=UPI003ECFC6B7
MPVSPSRETSSVDWPDPVEAANPRGASPVLLLCEHASRHIPAEYAQLGLDAAQTDRHIAWDIGAAALTRHLSELLDATAFLGAYSRLLVDLNRPLGAASSIPVRSEDTDIPGNLALSDAERRRRADRIFTPFHHAVARHLDERQACGRPTLLVTVHSFTPVFLGQARPWHAGVLFGKSRATAERLARRLSAGSDRLIGLNQPYQVNPEDDYALPIYGDGRDIPAVLIEVRNDQLADQDGVEGWATRLAAAITAEIEEIGG